MGGRGSTFFLGVLLESASEGEPKSTALDTLGHQVSPPQLNLTLQQPCFFFLELRFPTWIVARIFLLGQSTSWGKSIPSSSRWGVWVSPPSTGSLKARSGVCWVTWSLEISRGPGHRARPTVAAENVSSHSPAAHIAWRECYRIFLTDQLIHLLGLLPNLGCNQSRGHGALQTLLL